MKIVAVNGIGKYVGPDFDFYSGVPCFAVDDSGELDIILNTGSDISTYCLHDVYLTDTITEVMNPPYSVFGAGAGKGAVYRVPVVAGELLINITTEYVYTALNGRLQEILEADASCDSIDETASTFDLDVDDLYAALCL